MKKAVVTVCIGEKFKVQAEISHSTIKAYADRIGAEFIVIDTVSRDPHWEKMQIYNLLLKYQRIIYLDTDLIVRDDCPNFFELVPESQLGIFNEGRFDDRSGSMMEAYREYHNPFPPKWDGTYYNTGVMVISRRHRHLFKFPERVVSLGMYEQGYLNMKILMDLDNDRSNEERIYELDYKHNRMSLADSYCGIHRCDSYIVHYAGAPPQVDVLKLMREDLANWERHKPDYAYEREIVFYMGGGMGDQLSAEPVIRFAMEHMFKDVKTNYTIVTNWPRFFTHLSVPCIIREKYEAMPRYDTPVKVLKTIPAPTESSLWQHWSHISGHTSDYAAINTLHRILPDENRGIHLQASLEGLVEVMDIAGNANGDMILVHPGKGWDSKTFPAVWWESVIQGLLDKGKRVGVIGTQISKKQGYVNIAIPDGAIDFRDLLSLDGLIALIATSCLVISNDSAPIHIAGAFDNNILLIATCRHPDYILPYREGNKYHKAFAFKKKLTIDDWDLSPTLIFKESADVVKGNILDYIPEPQEVVDKALEMIGQQIFPEKTEQEMVMEFMAASTTLSKANETFSWNEGYEPEVHQFFRDVLSPGDNVVDVGAAAGIFTEFASRLTGGIVAAFEPEQNSFASLKQNINGNKNVRLYNNAVGDNEKEVEIYFNFDGDGNSLWDPAEYVYNKMTKSREPSKQKVQMVRLDDVIDFAPKLIKTDTEGCELMVLRGAERLLREHKPYVVCELNTFAMEKMGTNQKELGTYMRSLGYKARTLPDGVEVDLETYVPQYANTNIVFME